MNKLLRAALERLSLYLPVVLMGLLALGTYWLVRNTPVFLPPQAQQPALHEPDYFLQNFSVKTFDASGNLRSEVFGAQARHYPDTDTLEIDRVRIRSFNQQGQLTSAVASRALTNSDASEVQLFGNAQVVREAMPDRSGQIQPRLEFRGEFLHAFLKTERLKSHRPVVLTRGSDQFSADALEFDNMDRVLRLHGRVHGVLVPVRAR